MHIVFYYNKKLPVKEYGGIERAIVWLIKGLYELGHIITFIGPQGSKIPYCTNIAAPFSEVKIPETEKLKGLIPKEADLIHFNSDGVFDKNYNFPSIVTLYGTIKNVGGLSERYCFISDAQRKYWGYPQNPVVHIGLDKSEYIYKEEKDDYFLFLSRVDWDVKGVDWAIEAANKAGVRLVIAGNVHRKSFVNSYWRGYLKKRLSDRILYVGPVGGELKAMLLAKAKALIFPTKWCEAFGIVTIEALASGTPVITTYNGAMPEIIRNGKTGFLCRSINDIVDAINKIDAIKSSDCLRSIEERFNYKRMASNYIDLYKSILKK